MTLPENPRRIRSCFRHHAHRTSAHAQPAAEQTAQPAVPAVT